ncbi:MAG: hypothetical protein VW258_15040, partial [Thalassolituus sp.]
ARFSVFGVSENGEEIPWDELDDTNHPEHPEWATWDTTEDIWNKWGILDERLKTLAGSDNGKIYIMDRDNDDYTAAITGVSSADPCVVTVASHGFAAGDYVTISGVVGIVDDDGNNLINNFDPTSPSDTFTPWLVTSVTSTTITLNRDTSNTTAWTSGGLISKPIEFRAKTVPFNPYRDQGRKVYVNHVEFLVDTNGGALTVDFYADDEIAPFKQGIIALTDNTDKRRQWLTVSVNNEADFFTMRMRQLSPALNLKITSIRIHAEEGGYTSA